MIGLWLVNSEPRIAPRRELLQRHSMRGASANRVNATSFSARSGNLRVQQTRQIARMEHVPHLMAGSFKAGVSHWPTVQMSVDPVRKNSLIRSPELTRSGHHTTTIDPNRQSKRESILQRQRLRAQFGAAIERDRRFSRKIHINNGRRYSAWQHAGAIKTESSVFNTQPKALQCPDGINATGTQQKETGTGELSKFPQVYHPSPNF